MPVLTEHLAPESGEGPVAAHGVQLGCPLSPRMLQSCHDDAAKFVHLLVSPGGNSLAQEDFIPFLQVHPRLPAAHALAPSSQACPCLHPGGGRAGSSEAGSMQPLQTRVRGRTVWTAPHLNLRSVEPDRG